MVYYTQEGDNDINKLPKLKPIVSVGNTSGKKTINDLPLRKPLRKKIKNKCACCQCSKKKFCKN